MNKTLTCIVCPMGCILTVQMENGKVQSVSGNTCPRGEKYGKTECTDPRRTVTTTAFCVDGSLVSVKTSAPIPKDKVMECMEKINALRVALPVYVGDVLLDNVFGAQIVATQNRRPYGKA